MKATERGILLLTCPLGEPGRKPLSVAQFRELVRRMQAFSCKDPDRQLKAGDLTGLGYSRMEAEHILELLEGDALLDRYLAAAKVLGIRPVTRVSEEYPVILRKRLGLKAPGVLWVRGDAGLLEETAIALVGSRELREENRRFAEEAGRQASRQGLVLVSGNARGADKAAQQACLEAGGSVISIVADELSGHEPEEKVLYISENSFEESFSPYRALSRNRIIHALGRTVLVAQADLRKGGTWDGTVKNLRQGWSPVVCFRDGSQAEAELEQLGAYGIGTEDLQDFCALGNPGQISFSI